MKLNEIIKATGAKVFGSYDNDLEVDGSCGPLTQQALGMIA